MCKYTSVFDRVDRLLEKARLIISLFEYIQTGQEKYSVIVDDDEMMMMFEGKNSFTDELTRQ